MRSGWESEREILSGEERGVEGRERQREREEWDGEKQRKRQVQERRHTCINLDKTGLTDYTGNVIYVTGSALNPGTLKWLPESIL